MKLIFAALVGLVSIQAAAEKFVCEAELSGATPEEIAVQKNEANRALISHAVGFPQRLRIATWNLDLLKHYVAIQSQDYDERAERIALVLGQYMRSDVAPDVLTMQEVWNKNERKYLDQVAADCGYRVIDVLGRQSPHHGLQIWVRESTALQVLDSGFTRFPRMRDFTAFEVAGRVWRGVLWVKLRLHDGQTVLISTTHLTPFAKLKYANRRKAQVVALADILDGLKVGVDHVALTGDLNIASEFSRDNSAEAKELSQIRILYPYLTERTGLRDSFRAVTPRDEPGYTYNSDFLRLKAMMKRRADKRLDYILSAEQHPGVAQVVQTSRTLFRSKWNAKGEKDDNGLYLSDHYLVLSSIDFFRVH